MSKKKTLTDNLNEAFFNMIINDKEETLEILKENEIDVKELNIRGKHFIDKLKAKATIDLGKQSNKAKLELYERALKFFNESKEQVLEILGERQYHLLNAQFRNAKDLSEDAIEDLLKDEAIIKLMEKLDASKKDK